MRCPSLVDGAVLLRRWTLKDVPRVRIPVSPRFLVKLKRYKHCSDKAEIGGSIPLTKTESLGGLAWCRRDLSRGLRH